MCIYSPLIKAILPLICSITQGNSHSDYWCQGGRVMRLEWSTESRTHWSSEAVWEYVGPSCNFRALLFYVVLILWFSKKISIETQSCALSYETLTLLGDLAALTYIIVKYYTHIIPSTLFLLLHIYICSAATNLMNILYI